MASIWALIALGPLRYREAGSKTRWKLSRPRYRGCPLDVRINVNDDAEVCLTILGNGRSGADCVEQNSNGAHTEVTQGVDDAEDLFVDTMTPS